MLAWLLVINVVTAAMYARDKAAAMRPGARRVRERTLWLLCVAGGHRSHAGDEALSGILA